MLNFIVYVEKNEIINISALRIPLYANIFKNVSHNKFM